ncbi:hypothetical protein MFC_01427 [Mesomycoplasma flocculare ATCC 27716]|nr:hypothetical protein MFC_01427 [Mesomycoplasma flocculare ATCC 27716]
MILAEVSEVDSVLMLLRFGVGEKNFLENGVFVWGDLSNANSKWFRWSVCRFLTLTESFFNLRARISYLSPGFKLSNWKVRVFLSGLTFATFVLTNWFVDRFLYSSSISLPLK